MRWGQLDFQQGLFHVRRLKADCYRDGEILIDVTGGHKATTAAGAAASIARGRRIQCVDMYTFQPRSYENEWAETPGG